MAVNYEQFGRVPSSTERTRQPRIEWLVRGEPHEERALAYGFCAIGAFVLGGVGYLHGFLDARGLVASIIVAFVTFVLSYRHMEGS